MSEPTKAASRAIVTVTLDVELPSAWGRDCTVGQVYDQAKREAVEALGIALTSRTGVYLDRTGIGGNVRIVGEVTVRSVIVPEKP